MEIINGALHPLARFSFGTTMPGARYGVRGAREKVTNWNTHAYEFAVRMGGSSVNMPRRLGAGVVQRGNVGVVR